MGEFQEFDKGKIFYSILSYPVSLGSTRVYMEATVYYIIPYMYYIFDGLLLYFYCLDGVVLYASDGATVCINHMRIPTLASQVS